jgi:hypothetical protein
MKEQELELMSKIYAICKYQFNVDDNFELSRKIDSINARHTAMYICKNHEELRHLSLESLSYGLSKTIGRRVKFNHSTILHAIRSVENYIDSKDKLSGDFRFNYKKIMKEVSEIPIQDVPIPKVIEDAFNESKILVEEIKASLDVLRKCQEKMLNAFNALNS